MQTKNLALFRIRLASRPMALGLIPAIRARGFGVPPCSGLIFGDLCLGLSAVPLEMLVSVLRYVSLDFAVIEVVPAEQTTQVISAAIPAIAIIDGA